MVFPLGIDESHEAEYWIEDAKAEHLDDAVQDATQPSGLEVCGEIYHILVDKTRQRSCGI